MTVTPSFGKMKDRSSRCECQGSCQNSVALLAFFLQSLYPCLWGPVSALACTVFAFWNFPGRNQLLEWVFWSLLKLSGNTLTVSHTYTCIYILYLYLPYPTKLTMNICQPCGGNFKKQLSKLSGQWRRTLEGDSGALVSFSLFSFPGHEVSAFALLGTSKMTSSLTMGPKQWRVQLWARTFKP